MRKLFLFVAIFFVLSLANVYAGCVVPTDGMVITEDTTFCPGFYNLPFGVEIGASNIELDCNGTILNGTGAGIWARQQSNVVIKNCNLIGYGITFSGYLYGTYNNVFTNNHFSNCGNCIFMSRNAGNFTISNNVIHDCGVGVYLKASDSIVSNNVISKCSFNGVRLSEGASDNLVKNNDISECQEGMRLKTGLMGTQTKNNTIEGNNLINNTNWGILVWLFAIDGNSSLFNIFRNNNFIDNYQGIGFLGNSSDNLIYHNNFINSEFRHAYAGLYTHNSWDYGYPTGGNYWGTCVDDYQGLYQNETGSDGICDNPYYIEFDNWDNYPLASEFVLDTDGDGVLDTEDKCPETVLPENIPTKRLLPWRHADTDGDGIFETRRKKNVVDSDYTLTDTHGCSCEQILESKPGKNRPEKWFGCAKRTMYVFINQILWAKDLFD